MLCCLKADSLLRPVAWIIRFCRCWISSLVCWGQESRATALYLILLSTRLLLARIFGARPFLLSCLRRKTFFLIWLEISSHCCLKSRSALMMMPMYLYDGTISRVVFPMLIVGGSSDSDAGKWMTLHLPAFRRIWFSVHQRSTASTILCGRSFFLLLPMT